LYAERGGSGAKIAQRASQAAEGKKTGFFNLNKIADKFQDPVDDKAAFLRVTGPELPPPSHGMLTGLPEQRRQPFFLPNNGAYQTTKAASLTNAAAGLPSPRSGGGEYSGTQQQMMPQDQQNLDFSAPQLPETSYEDFQKTSDDLAAQRAQKQQQTSFADFESISNEMAARRKR
jgi:hypothetical protein